jgi:hypothetical protein
MGVVQSTSSVVFLGTEIMGDWCAIVEGRMAGGKLDRLAFDNLRGVICLDLTAAPNKDVGLGRRVRLAAELITAAQCPNRRRAKTSSAKRCVFLLLCFLPLLMAA